MSTTKKCINYAINNSKQLRVITCACSSLPSPLGDGDELEEDGVDRHCAGRRQQGKAGQGGDQRGQRVNAAPGPSTNIGT